MTEEQYIPLIHRSLTDQMSAEESVHLKEWLALSAQNQAVYSEIIEAWERSKNIDWPITVNTDLAFNKFLSNTQAQTLTSRTTPSQIRTKTVRRLWPTLGAIAAIGLLIMGVIWAWQATQIKTPILVETIATTPRTLVTLPDQSVVTLNKGAKISYDPAFGQRQIQLVGEAFFEVTKNPVKPFTILTEKTATTVLGTSFNIKNETNKTVVTVFTGKVSFADRAQQSSHLILIPNQRGIYQLADQSLSKEEDVSLETINWQKATIAYQDQPLSKILPDLETFYNVTIELKEPTLNNCTFTGSFQRASLQDALDALAFGMNLTFTKTENRIMLTGEGCLAN